MHRTTRNGRELETSTFSNAIHQGSSASNAAGCIIKGKMPNLRSESRWRGCSDKRTRGQYTHVRPSPCLPVYLYLLACLPTANGPGSQVHMQWMPQKNIITDYWLPKTIFEKAKRGRNLSFPALGLHLPSQLGLPPGCQMLGAGTKRCAGADDIKPGLRWIRDIRQREN
ncbi:hypothetical protein B0T22DRAFT_118766 [Podospora appendiculata]|uniref:Uncharacterized protein n=1 Tax=Podospora appendiculata TaxID=314037 RepID=A0AAE0WYP4_9PEZI|nr:hypothetical protein B0T22DRAFT_118766 [Podospora appendiculata]